MLQMSVVVNPTKRVLKILSRYSLASKQYMKCSKKFEGSEKLKADIVMLSIGKNMKKLKINIRMENIANELIS